jgi:hypothetical protein
MQATRTQVGALIRLVRHAAVALTLLVVATQTVAAQSAPLVGLIVDAVGTPIEGARITVRGVKARAYSNAEGRFVVPSAPRGLIVVMAQPQLAFPLVEILRNEGRDSLVFIAQRIGASEDTTIALQAERAAEKTADRYARVVNAARSAVAFTDREIARRAPQVTSDLFVGLVGFRVSGGGARGTVTSARDGCFPTVWLDDVEQIRFNVNEIRPSAIKLLVAWNGFSLIPANLRSVRADPTCGAVLIVLK